MLLYYSRLRKILYFLVNKRGFLLIYCCMFVSSFCSICTKNSDSLHALYLQNHCQIDHQMRSPSIYLCCSVFDSRVLTHTMRGFSLTFPLIYFWKFYCTTRFRRLLRLAFTHIHFNQYYCCMYSYAIMFLRFCHGVLLAALLTCLLLASLKNLYV